MLDTMDRDPYANFTGVATRIVSVTPDDANNLPEGHVRSLYIGGTGNLRVTTVFGDDQTLAAVPVGFILPVAIKKVWSTGTTASLLKGLI